MIKSWRLSELQQPLAAIERRGDARFNRVSTDTRSLQPGDLFVALSGPNYDTNRFVAAARAAGAVAAVVSELQPLDLPQLLVADGRLALGRLAAFNRDHCQAPLVAITGSSGKTSVKEMLASILRGRGKVLATRGNLNNEIGVPLTLLELEADHRYGVIELGASGAGEIAYTVGLTRPAVAVLNNAGGAHLEGFGSLQGVVKAKGEIFTGLAEEGIGVVNLDDPNAPVWLQQLQGRRSLTFSLCSPRADLFASHLQLNDDGCYSFVLNSHQAEQPLSLKVMGQHMVANALAAAAAAQALGLSLQEIADGLQRFSAVAGRLVVTTTAAGVRVIDDSYNANPDSVKAAISVLKDLPGERVLVLGGMAELGAEAAELHRQVGRFAASQGIDRLLTSGTLAAPAAAAFRAEGGDAREFENNQALAFWLQQQLTGETVVLVKGSRSAGMESVVNSLIAGGEH